MGHNALAGNGLLRYYTDWDTLPEATPEKVTHFPPGFPLLLAGVEALGLQPRSHDLIVVNAILLFVSLSATGFVVLRLTNSGVWGGLAVLLTLTGWFMTFVYLYVWSEPLFIALLTSATAFLVLYLQTGRWLPFLLSACLYSLMWLTRYAAVGIVPTVVILNAFALQMPIARRIRNTLIYTAVLCLPFTIWIIRNQTMSEPLLGYHALTWEPLNSNLKLFLFALHTGFHGRLGSTGILLVIFPLATFALHRWYHQYASNHIQNQQWWLLINRTASSPITLLAALWLGYWLFILLGGTIGSFIVDLRKLAPAFPLMIALLVTLTHDLAHAHPDLWLYRLLTPPMLLGLTFLILSSGISRARLALALAALAIVGPGWLLLRTRRKAALHATILHLTIAGLLTTFISGDILYWMGEGENRLQRSGNFIDHSEVITWLRETVTTEVIYTNEWERIYYYAIDLNDARIRDLPRADKNDSVEEFVQHAIQTGGYVIYSEYRHRQELIPEEELMADEHFILFASFKDGRVYQIQPDD
jgi:hypothetical protein